jgi:hypothetical protein
MKAPTLVFAAMAAIRIASATDLAPYPGELRGKIIQITRDGMLVDGAFKTGETDDTSRPIILSGTFFLRGIKRDMVDGDPIDVKALLDGSYSYTTVLGATVTVKALRYSD